VTVCIELNTLCSEKTPRFVFQFISDMQCISDTPKPIQLKFVTAVAAAL